MQKNTREDWQTEQLRTIEDIQMVSDQIVQSMTDAGFSDKDKFSMRLALEEAIVNAIRHGNENDPQKTVHVSYQVGDGQVVAEVSDEGAGFDPESLPDPLAPENLEKPAGRGVFLMRVYMTWIKFNDVGNCVTLCRAKSTPEQPESAND